MAHYCLLPLAFDAPLIHAGALLYAMLRCHQPAPCQRAAAAATHDRPYVAIRAAAARLLLMLDAVTLPYTMRCRQFDDAAQEATRFAVLLAAPMQYATMREEASPYEFDACYRYACAAARIVL